MRISLSTASLIHFSLATILSMCRQAGFDGVELAIGAECAIKGLDKIERMVDSGGIPVLSIHAPMMRLSGWKGTTNIVLQTVEWANRLNCRVVTFHPPAAKSTDEACWEEFFQSMEAGKAACRNGLQIAIENRVYLPGTSYGKRYLLDDHPKMLEFVKTNNLGFTFDTSHSWITEGDIVGPYRLFRDALVNVHFSDVNRRNLPASLILLHTILTQHQLPGTGIVPLRELLQEMALDEYQGLLTLEISPVSLSAWSKGSAMKRMIQGLEYCQDSHVMRSVLSSV